MAQDLERSWTPPTTLSLVQRSTIAKRVLSQSTSLLNATKAAKQLVGSYAFLKAPDVDAFQTAIAAVLQQYPQGLVDECVDPRRGAARSIKFLGVAELVEWLDRRLEFHRALAAYVPPKQLPARAFPADHKATMAERWARLLAQLFSGARREDPVTKLRRESREQAARQLAADKAHALTDLAAGA